MYVKYLNNIHNLNIYNSIIKGGPKNNCIQLQSGDGHFHSMEFKNIKSRDFVLNEIWEEMKKESKLFDIDSIIETYYISNDYNI